MSRPTAEEIEDAKTPAGGWTREQLAEWGVPWPPPEGWRRRLVSPDDADPPRWQHFSVGLIAALEVAANAFELRAQCESPIEVMIGAQIQALINRSGEKRITLQAQYRLERFRYDFALRVRNVPIVLIECDGAEFHSTPEQVENDQRKNVAAAQAGLALLRFSGSEINRDAYGCAVVVLNEMILRLRPR